MDKTESTKRNTRALIAVITAVLMVLLAVIFSFVFNFQIVGNLVMCWILTTLYCIFAILLIGDQFVIQRTVEIEKPVYIDKPVIKEVIKEVPIQIPMENQTIKVIEKPVIQRVEVPVYKYKKVYVEKKRKKLNIPKFDYVGSNETKRFHTRFCRLGKLIKKKFKVHSNSRSFFIKKHYKACKACIKKQKKI